MRFFPSGGAACKFSYFFLAALAKRVRACCTVAVAMPQNNFCLLHMSIFPLAGVAYFTSLACGCFPAKIKTPHANGYYPSNLGDFLITPIFSFFFSWREAPQFSKSQVQTTAEGHRNMCSQKRETNHKQEKRRAAVASFPFLLCTHFWASCFLWGRHHKIVS